VDRQWLREDKMPVYVKAYRRAGNLVKNYTRMTFNHRSFQKILKKGHFQQRAAKAVNKISGQLGEANSLGRVKRAKQLNKRINTLRTIAWGKRKY
jgi:uncharacterized protein HemY